MGWAKWAVKWIGIYVICNLITVIVAYISILAITMNHTVSDDQLSHWAGVRVMEDYKDAYIRKLATDPNAVACQSERSNGNDTAFVTCSVFDEGKLVLKRTYLYTTNGLSAGELAGFEDWDIPIDGTKSVER